MTSLLTPSPSIQLRPSQEMEDLFSLRTTHILWRRLWVALAETQHEVGLPVSASQVDRLKQMVDEIPLMEGDGDHQDTHFHLHLFGDQCDHAHSILGLGVTEAYVEDNAFLIQVYRALGLLLQKGVQALREMHTLSLRHIELPCLAYYAFQPTSVTTVGKRIALWMQNLLSDMYEVERRLSLFKFLGNKGIGGGQYALTKMLEDNGDAVRQLEQLLRRKMGFSHLFTLTGERYPLKQDRQVLCLITQIGESLHGIARDVCQWSQTREIEEHHEGETSLSPTPIAKRALLLLEASTLLINDAQMMVLEDGMTEHGASILSSRTKMEHTILQCDALLTLLISLIRSLLLHPEKMREHVFQELPYWATEEIVALALERGVHREELHQKMRLYQQTALHQRKREGTKPHPLLRLFIEDSEFPLNLDDFEALLDPIRFIGQAASQTKIFCERDLTPFLAKYQSLPNPIA